MKKTIFERRREVAKRSKQITVGFYDSKKDIIHDVEQIYGDPQLITKAAFQVSMLYQSGRLPSSLWFASTDDDFRVFCLSNDPELLTDGLCDRVEQKLNIYKLKGACFQA